LHAGHCPSHCRESSPHSAHTYAVFVCDPAPRDPDPARATTPRRVVVANPLAVDVVDARAPVP
jgi:hypothetical protein